MKKKLGDLLLSLILFTIGVCLMFWAGEVIRIVTILLGSIFILYGLITLFRYIKYEPKSVLSLTIGILSIIIGIILLVRQNIISEIISFIVGIFIVITSIGSLTNTIEQKGKNYTIGIGLSIAGIVIGVLCIIGKLLIPSIILQFMGVLLVIFSVINIINTLVSPVKE